MGGLESLEQESVESGDNIPRPTFRRLRGYAFDPSLSVQMDTALVNEVVFKLRWEELRGDDQEPGLPRIPGPRGEYIEVV